MRSSENMNTESTEPDEDLESRLEEGPCEPETGVPPEDSSVDQSRKVDHSGETVPGVPTEAPEMEKPEPEKPDGERGEVMTAEPEQPKAPATPEPMSGPGSASTEPGSRLRYKIGSLREGQSKEDIRPRPISPAAPRPVGDSSSAVSSSADSLSPDSPSRYSKDAGSKTGPRRQGERETPDDRPDHSRKKIIRELPEEKKSHYPPPDLRAQLPPELEAEVEAALGGASLESLLAGEEEASCGESIEQESRVNGRVVTVHREDVFFDLGGRNQGVAPLKQFDNPPQPGDEVDLIVGRFNAEDGIYEVSVPGASVEIGDWSGVTEGLVVDVTITGHNKGGLECEAGKLRGFIPAGQIALYHVDDFEQFVDQKIACVILEANPERRNLVLSRRAVLEREQAERREELMTKLGPGQRYEGTVTSLQKFGAFVDIGGVEGLIHISKLSWNRIAHADQVLSLGQKVNVIVDKFDSETGKISFEYADREESPWKSASINYPATSLARGTVTKTTDFGAFVQLEPGVEGLIHISELAHRRVHRVTDVVKEGDQVDVQVLSIDPQAQRMSLSLKALEAAPAAKKSDQQKQEDEATAELEAEAGKNPKAKPEDLQGGLGGPSGGEQFGLKW